MSTHAMHPRRRRLWPATLSGLLAAAMVVALVAVFLVRREDKAVADAQLTLAEGVTAGGSVTGQGRSA